MATAGRNIIIPTGQIVPSAHTASVLKKGQADRATMTFTSMSSTADAIREV